MAARLAAGAVNRKLACRRGRRHCSAMRVLVLSSALLLAACTADPPQPPAPGPGTPPPAPQVRRNLYGMTAGELVQRFGPPTLQVREGAGLKLQFRGNACVLDAYLYPPAQGGGAERVTHVDARLRSGNDTDQSSCIAALQGA